MGGAQRTTTTKARGPAPPPCLPGAPNTPQSPRAQPHPGDSAGGRGGEESKGRPTLRQTDRQRGVLERLTERQMEREKGVEQERSGDGEAHGGRGRGERDVGRDQAGEERRVEVSWAGGKKKGVRRGMARGVGEKRGQERMSNTKRVSGKPSDIAATPQPLSGLPTSAGDQQRAGLSPCSLWAQPLPRQLPLAASTTHPGGSPHPELPCEMPVLHGGI